MNAARRTVLFASLAACALGLGCTEPVDKAAKKRIFSPEDPPKAVASASEKLPPENVADDPRIARRILGMGAAEATERIGPHKYTASVTFEWTAAGSGKSTRLVETRSLVAGRGGVSGDFHGTIDNSRDQGLEVLRVAGQVFARNKYGKFRQRLRDRGIAEREREEIFGAIGDIDELFQGRLKLAPQGTVTHEGRTTWRYVASLGAPMQAATETQPKLPAPVQPKNGVDETTKRRMTFFEKRDPKSLQGEVLVDAETSVVVKARLDGRIEVVADEGPANLRVVLDAAMSEIGKEQSIAAPKDFLPDQDKPLGIAAALDKFGIQRKAKTDAGVGAEPEDEDSDEPGASPGKKP